MAEKDKLVNLEDLKAAYDNVKAMLAITEESSTASAAHVPGTDSEIFIMGGVLYQATSDIGIGDTITPNTNCKEASIGKSVSDLKSAVDSHLLNKFRLVTPANWLDQSAITDGILYANGTTGESTALFYTDYIPVDMTSKIRVYTMSNGNTDYRYHTTCYDANKSVLSSSGSDSQAQAAYVIANLANADKIKYVRLTLVKAHLTYKMQIVLDDVKPESYSAYVAPYDVLDEDFLTPESEAILDDAEEKLPSLELENVQGYNLKDTGQRGTGAYYVSSGKVYYDSSLTTYRYLITPVKPNTWYKASVQSEWYIFTDDNDNVISGARARLGRYFNTGEATKLYYTVSVSSMPLLIIAEGVHGTPQGLKKTALLSGITQNMRNAAYGCALPPFTVRFTKDMQETFYNRNILSIPDNYIVASFAGFSTKNENGININPANVTTGNGYVYSVYDSCFAKIEGNLNAAESYIVKADAINNCSVLVIGDSTVARGTMTQKMLDAFTAREKTLTLLGTLGTAPNKNEGRAGWSTSNYMRGGSYEGVVNPFYNPETETFDFSYYMENQNYNAVDFVIIQLGINDLYSTSFDDVESIIDGAISNICSMIDSILTFNSSQKILLNLPTPCNTDYSVALSDIPPITMAKYIMYNQKIQLVVTKYGASKVRCSNCHLILDGSTDIDDHVHPTTAGFTKMANEVVSQINVWQNGG